MATKKFGIVVHAGAGKIRSESVNSKTEGRYRTALKEAIKRGYSVLEQGGVSIDAVQAAVQWMEDFPLFNAGKGAVLRNDGRVQLDASIMEGTELGAGAVAGLTRIKNPVQLARLVMDRSGHLMMVGAGAEKFARSCGLKFVDPSYFVTAKRVRELKRLQAELAAQRAANRPPIGTVGAVALDTHGQLAAATSTGGMANNLYDRIGDTPIIGAGTYADNNGCAVSCTGHGEYFIRTSAARTVSLLVDAGGLTPLQAVREVLFGQIVPIGGTGGLIAIDRRCRIALDYSTEGMFRGFKLSSGKSGVAIFED